MLRLINNSLLTRLTSRQPFGVAANEHLALRRDSSETRESGEKFISARKFESQTEQSGEPDQSSWRPARQLI